MGLNLRKIGKKLTDFGSRVYDQANIFDSGRSYQTRTPSVEASQRSVLQQAPTVARTVIRYSPLGAAGRVFSAAGSALPKAPTSNAFGRGVNTFVVDPFKETLPRVGGAMQGENVYHGSLRQQAGQVLEDQINLASLLPVGKAAQVVGRGGKLTVNAVKQGAKTGSKVGAGFGAAQGVSTSLQNEMGLKDAAINTALSTGIGTVAGGALGAAVPVVGEGVRLAVKGAKSAAPEVKPVYADYQPKLKSKVSMDNQAGKEFAAKVRAKDVRDGKVVRNINDNTDPLQAAQDIQTQRYKQTPVVKFRNRLGRQMIDPRNVEQRMDNAEYKYQKSTGQTKKGQHELSSEQSLAEIRGRIHNPHRAANERSRTKYATDNGEYSVNDIIRYYGKESSQKARDFETYRLYKDELEQMSLGGKNSLPFDPADMQARVDAYEAANPLAKPHNAALRAKELAEVAEKEAAGIVPAGTTERLSQRQFYTPRALTSPEELQKVRIQGGVRSGQKGVKSRGVYNEAPTSPLSLFRNNSVAHERDLANQQYGLELRRRVQEGRGNGMTESVDADVVIQHKAFQREAKLLGEEVAITKRVRDKLASAAKATGSKAKGAQRSLKAAEDKVVARMQTLLEKAKANRNDVMNDLVSRDPRYEAEAQAIKNQKFPNLTKKEAQEQIKYDLAQLDKKYPAPGPLTREELLDLADRIAYDGTPVKKAAQAKGEARAKSQRVQQEADDLNAMLRQSREDLATLGEKQSEVNQAFRDTTQGQNRNTQSYQYRVDGEIGRIELTGELAESLSKQNEQVIQGVIDKGLRPISNAQKLMWTGLLQPAFKLYNVLVKNPVLMFYNADGLSGIRPEVAFSFARQLVNTKKMAAFRKEMRLRSAAYENAFQTTNIHKEVADDIARRANLTTFAEGFLTNPIRSLGDVWRGMSAALASVDNAQRTAVSYGAYKRAKGLGFSEKEALDQASRASAKVFGDFDRVTQLAQAMEGIIPYTGATQAGVRAMGRATKIKPVESAAKATILATGMAGLTAYSVGNANEYYNDMINQGKEYQLDNNWTIAFPGAGPKLDESGQKTGEWAGIINIPLVPDLRPMNRAIWRSVHGIANEDGVDPNVIAAEVFNQTTGDMANQLYDSKRAQGNNPATGVLPSSPVANLVKTANNINTYTGKPLANEYTQSLERTKQGADKASKGANQIAQLTRGVLTPQQADQLLNQMGNTGDTLQQKEGFSGLQQFIKPLKPGVSLTDKQKSGKIYSEHFDAASKGLDERTFREFQAKHTKNPNKGLLNSADNALSYLNNSRLYEADKKLDSLERKSGKPGNPLFDLTPEQTQKVLTYRSAKIYNSAGQNKDKNGQSSYIALGLDEKWYDDFKQKESQFYSKLAQTGDDEAKTFSGSIKPKATPEMEKKLEYYYTLGKGTGQRSAFLRANPDVLAYWDSQNEFTNEERVALGFNKTSKEDQGGSKYGYGSGKSSNYGTSNPLKYAISLKTGGAIAKPKVSVKKSGTAKGGKTAKRAAPKVSIKKSLV